MKSVGLGLVSAFHRLSTSRSWGSMGTSLEVFVLVLCFTKGCIVSDTAAQVSNLASKPSQLCGGGLWRGLVGAQQGSASIKLSRFSELRIVPADRSTLVLHRSKLAKLGRTTGGSLICISCSSFVEKHLVLNLGGFYRNQAHTISNRQSCKLMLDC
ncbi:MAG: hypothetical protein CM15mP77_1060 [Synechococcus sp.]|nr:MAG: hypothetical protein CM15mP77_1060 [Synechococcus sp.]